MSSITLQSSTRLEPEASISPIGLTGFALLARLGQRGVPYQYMRMFFAAPPKISKEISCNMLDGIDNFTKDHIFRALLARLVDEAKQLHRVLYMSRTKPDLTWEFYTADDPLIRSLRKFKLRDGTATIGYPNHMLQRFVRDVITMVICQLVLRVLANLGSTHASGDATGASSKGAALLKDGARSDSQGISNARNGAADPNRAKRARNNEDESDEERDDQKKRKSTPADRVPLSLRLACPFYKAYPTKLCTSRSCLGPGWETVHRLKYDVRYRQL